MMGNDFRKIKPLYFLIADRDNSLFFTELPRKNYTFNALIYSSYRNRKCSSLNLNFNKILLKRNTFLNSYNWTLENICNINVDHK